ncbi:MAG: toll/interleukin-1 receptor domain-containing protein [Actinomycetota bacterium]
MLFISHRHEDRALADVLRRFIEARTGGRVRVFQSSSPGAKSPRQGGNLREELQHALWHASVVVLLYTTGEQDWSFCMWECGVAQLPGPSSTKMVVFQCTDQVPMVFADQVRVGVRNEQNIEKFVNDQRTEPLYFPKLGRAVTDFNAGTEPVQEAARKLYHALQDVLPTPDDVGEEWPPYPQLTMELTDEQMERIRKAEGPAEKRLSVARQVVVEEALVTGGDGQVGRIFSARGFPRNPSMPGIPMRVLVSGWEANSPTSASRWVDGMCSQILTTALDQFPTPRWELMRGADRTDWTLYGPMVRYIKKFPRRKCTEIDVIFCKFELDDGNQPKIWVPKIELET